MKVRIKSPQTGLYNGQPWPKVGDTIDLPAHVAQGMIANQHAEPVGSKTETRPAPTDAVETRGQAAPTPKKSSSARKK